MEQLTNENMLILIVLAMVGAIGYTGWLRERQLRKQALKQLDDLSDEYVEKQKIWIANRETLIKQMDNLKLDAKNAKDDYNDLETVYKELRDNQKSPVPSVNHVPVVKPKKISGRTRKPNKDE